MEKTIKKIFKNKRISLWKIFTITAKIGGVTIGGGYAMIPVLKEELVDKNKFISPEEFSTILVIAQSLPGPVAVNTSTIVGYKLRKLPGAISAVGGTIFFPTLIILLIAIFLDAFQSLLSPFLRGMKLPLFAIFVFTVFKLWKSTINSKKDIVIFLITFALLTFLRFNPILLIALFILYEILKNTILNLIAEINRANIVSGKRRKKGIKE
ncbi:MAG: chromate transporter [Fervidobacterium sp.]